ncbi:MAG: alanine racemase [Candidatus Limivicinus sp.]
MNNSMNIMNNSYLYIDMHLFSENMHNILKSLPCGCSLIPVLKNDAYGLGLEKIAAAVCKYDNVSCIALAHISEGLRLRKLGITKDILILGCPVPFLIPAAIEAGLTLTLGSRESTAAVEREAERLGMRAAVQIKLDTGLHRIGIEPGDELESFILQLRDCRMLDIKGVYSHFSNAEDELSDERQFRLYLSALDTLEKNGIKAGLRHISCSAAFELYPEYSLDAVRLGRRLFMDAPGVSGGEIQEPASWRSFITAVKLRRKGDKLGYGGKITLNRDRIVATVGVGYGDGLNPALCEVNAPVLIHGRRCPLLNCCMDQCLVDVTGLDCRAGDEVTFFGHDSKGNFLSSQEVAALIGDNEGCGLTSALSRRVARIYSE